VLFIDYNVFILFLVLCFCRFSVLLYWLCVLCLLPVGVTIKNCATTLCHFWSHHNHAKLQTDI